MLEPQTTTADVRTLAERARGLVREHGSRVLIAITGTPGAGKSTLAEALVAELGERAVLVPMDGFHYSQRMLARLGRSERKGAPDTFDAAGLEVLLTRIRTAVEPIYAPTFDRSIEEPIAAGTVVPAEADIVVVEGNYLLLAEEPWAPFRALFEEAWFIRVPDDVRRARLIARHREFGRTREEAEAWVAHVDEPNARLIGPSAARADLILTP